MKSISLQDYGKLERSGDGWRCWNTETKIGSVDIDVDGDIADSETISSNIISVLERIDDIDVCAKNYLKEHAPSDFENAKGLIEPCLFFDSSEVATCTFTIFYSGTDPDNELRYGVEFREFAPFNFVIGD